MAVCWNIPLSRLDSDAAWSPERYSPSRAQHHALTAHFVPLAQFAVLQKGTFDPARSVDRWGEYIVLDTNHAYEGRIQFRGKPVSIKDVGSIKRPLQSGFVIVSRLRTYLRQVAVVDDFYEGFTGLVVSSSEFYALSPASEREDIAFLVPFLLSAEVQKLFAHAEEGGHHPRIHADVLMGLAVPQGIFERRAELSARFRESLKLIRDGERVQTAVHAEVVRLAAVRPETTVPRDRSAA